MVTVGQALTPAKAMPCTYAIVLAVGLPGRKKVTALCQYLFVLRHDTGLGRDAVGRERL